MIWDVLKCVWVCIQLVCVCLCAYVGLMRRTIAYDPLSVKTLTMCVLMNSIQRILKFWPEYSYTPPLYMWANGTGIYLSIAFYIKCPSPSITSANGGWPWHHSDKRVRNALTNELWLAEVMDPTKVIWKPFVDNLPATCKYTMCVWEELRPKPGTEAMAFWSHSQKNLWIPHNVYR